MEQKTKNRTFVVIAIAAAGTALALGIITDEQFHIILQLVGL